MLLALAIAAVTTAILILTAAVPATGQTSGLVDGLEDNHFTPGVSRTLPVSLRCIR